MLREACAIAKEHEPITPRWEEFADAASPLLERAGLATRVELPAHHWMLRMSHKSVAATFKDGRSLQPPTLCHSRVRI